MKFAAHVPPWSRWDTSLDKAMDNKLAIMAAPILDECQSGLIHALLIIFYGAAKWFGGPPPPSF
jgi:hypothetical protein